MLGIHYEPTKRSNAAPRETLGIISTAVTPSSVTRTVRATKLFAIQGEPPTIRPDFINEYYNERRNGDVQRWLAGTANAQMCNKTARLQTIVAGRSSERSRAGRGRVRSQKEKKEIEKKIGAPLHRRGIGPGTSAGRSRKRASVAHGRRAPSPLRPLHNTFFRLPCCLFRVGGIRTLHSYRSISLALSHTGGGGSTGTGRPYGAPQNATNRYLRYGDKTITSDPQIHDKA
ncbi:unnamed protein product, partial [Iphiclides podalirius]